MKIHTLLALICLSLIPPTLFGQTNAPADGTNVVTTPPPVAQPVITNTITPFQQAVLDYQQRTWWSDAQNVAKLSAAMDTLPPLPAEARRHFVMGQTMFKAAANTNDFLQAYTEFQLASTNAPWVAKIWYNMALAEEAAGKYDFATNCLQVYQDFKLSDADAQEAQDKVYEIQAKQQLAAKHAADEQAAAAANAQAEEAAKIQSEIRIGGSYGGGIVFYIDGTGQHGLIAATADQGTGTWNQCVQLCKDYRGGGFSDWFMPSADQINTLYAERNVVGGFADNNHFPLYWTSTENNEYNVTVYGFEGSGPAADKDKSYPYDHVRAIRAF